MLTLGAWMHDLDPWVFRLTDTFGVRWYGLSYVAGFALAWVLLRLLIARGAVLIPKERAADVILTAAFGAVVGGRLGYVVFYQPAMLGFDASFPFWGVLRLNEGGMASHGGMVGVAVSAWLISRGFKNDAGERVGRVPFGHVLDMLALVAPAGLLLGRLANFVNGELLGRIVAKGGEPAPWWAVRYPQEVLERSDTELAYTPNQWEELVRLADDYAPAADSFESGYLRVMELLQRGGSAANDIAARLEPVLNARHPSQLYQAAAEGLAVGVVLWTIGAFRQRPGTIFGSSLIVYGGLRILTEVYRLPDSHLEPVMGLSRGQWLSVGMIGVGVAMLAWIRWRHNEKIGGWLKGVGQPAG